MKDRVYRLLNNIAEKLPKLPRLNPNEKKKFDKAKLPGQNFVLKLFVIIIFCFSLLSLLINPKGRNDADFYVYRAILLFTSVFVLFSERMNLLRTENNHLFLNFSAFFFFSEGLLKNIEIGGRLTCFVIGIYTEIFIFSLIIAKVRWLRTILFIWTSNIFCAIRYLPFGEKNESSIFPSLLIVLNITLMSTFSYLMERDDKENFISNRKKEFSLSCFRQLIIEVIPFPIIITIGEEIIFKNDEVTKILDCYEDSELLDKFENITIDSPGENIFESFQGLSFEAEKNKAGKTPELELLKPLGEIELKKSSDKEFERLNLREVLRLSKEKLINKKSFVKHFMSVYEPGHEENGGSQQYFDVKLKNIVWEERDSLMIILTENKTIQEIKQLKQESLYKDNLLATVSHDLRTPINGITGIIAETVQVMQDVTIKKSLGVALRSAKFLLYMVNDILDFHQIANKRLKLSFEYVSLWDVIIEVSKLIKFQAKMKGLKFIKENRIFRKESKAVIKTDPNRLKQVVLNLLGNALKFTTEGSIKISLEELLEKNDEIPGSKALNHSKFDYLISVEDTGIGIKKEDQGRLFKLFGKLENKQSTLNRSGVGLGLAISQNLIKMLNKNEPEGEIRVASEYGKGSRFYFPLKSYLDEENYANMSPCSELDFVREVLDFGFCSNDEESRLKSSLIKSASAKTFSKFRNNEFQTNLLLVDDDQINIVVATSYLKSDPNFRYDIANNGLQAVEIVKFMAAQKKFYDIILMDCNMPIMNGYQAAEIVRELIKINMIPELAIIACTADTAASDRELCFKSGMNDILVKPFLKNDFFSILRKHSNRENK